MHYRRLFQLEQALWADFVCDNGFVLKELRRKMPRPENVAADEDLFAGAP